MLQKISRVYLALLLALISFSSSQASILEKIDEETVNIVENVSPGIVTIQSR